MPRSFRGEESRGYPENAIEPYRHPSMIERYKRLAIVFAIISLVLAAYVVKWIVTAKPKPPPPRPPEQSVYIDAVPRQGVPPQQDAVPPQEAPARKDAPPR